MKTVFWGAVILGMFAALACYAEQPTPCAALRGSIREQRELIGQAEGLTGSAKVRTALMDADLSLADFHSELPDDDAACLRAQGVLDGLHVADRLRAAGLVAPPAPTEAERLNAMAAAVGGALKAVPARK